MPKGKDMTVEEALERLQWRLDVAIDKWMESVCESREFVALNRVFDDDLSSFMAKAALAVLESTARFKSQKKTP